MEYWETTPKGQRYLEEYTELSQADIMVMTSLHDSPLGLTAEEISKDVGTLSPDVVRERLNRLDNYGLVRRVDYGNL